MTDKDILSLIKKSGGRILTSELIKATGLSKSRISTRITRLVNDNKVTKTRTRPQMVILKHNGGSETLQNLEGELPRNLDPVIPSPESPPEVPLKEKAVPKQNLSSGIPKLAQNFKSKVPPPENPEPLLPLPIQNLTFDEVRIKLIELLEKNSPIPLEYQVLYDTLNYENLKGKKGKMQKRNYKFLRGRFRLFFNLLKQLGGN